MRKRKGFGLITSRQLTHGRGKSGSAHHDVLVAEKKDKIVRLVPTYDTTYSFYCRKGEAIV
jgi:hypothetical protein